MANQPVSYVEDSLSDDPRRWLILAGVWLSYTAFGLNVASLAPLVALIEADLGISHSAMGGVLGAWQLVYIGTAIPCGILLDRIGSRHAFTFGALLMTASAFGRSYAGDFSQLLLAVGVFGLGGPIVSAGAPKVVAEWFRGRERGLAMGIYITGPGIGAILALSLTNSTLMPIVDNDWRVVLRIWSVVSLTAAIFWVVLSRVVVLNSFRATSRSEGLQVLSLLQMPPVQMILLMGIGVLFFTHGLSNWLPELLRSGGMQLDQAGFWAAVPAGIAIIGALVIPRFATPSHRILVLLMLFLGAMGASLLLRAESEILLFGGLMLDGIARSSMMTVLILILVEIRGVGEKRAGTAGGLFFATAEIGGVTGPVMLGVLYDATGGFSAGLGLLTTISLLLLLALVFLRRQLAVS